MKHRPILPAVILFWGMLNGCGAVRPSKYYQLTVPDEGTLRTGPAHYSVTLLLGPITTSNLYRDDHIVYSSEGQAMGVYEYHRWAEPPSELINDVLLRELQMSGCFQHVYSMRSDTRGDYILRGRLYDLREISESTLAARVSFEFELRDSRTGTTVWSRYYSHDEPVDGKNVNAVVGAMDRNVQSGLREVIGGLEQYFSSHTAVAAAVAP